MDPYLEAPEIWPDLHDRLATKISAILNATLPAPFYARLEIRSEIGIIDEGPVLRRIVPDVAIVRPPAKSAGGSVAVVEVARTRISPSYEIEVLDSDANLIELDLLRSGERLVSPALAHIIDQLNPTPDYLVIVNRAWRRLEENTAYQIFPVAVTESLPCIPIPLREGQDEVPLDLQFVFQRAYDSGPYRRGAIDYSSPPDPALRDEPADWAAQCLRTAAIQQDEPKEWSFPSPNA
jgi:hypothetical protein